ncbi:hypothetical protein EIP75_20590 [Aquabacterium soli]|jgi:hypothetical protein|uniref:Uncharacterized protein n=1 Tax=Aquabacterium soli TaxID=2493092 RepID=A0A426V6P6_9BURK|nr:hypothetical protein [Aquabacterium soli]RRS02470.1 hypothetical protein EIP75_20590 [Aquabacterium soli]
MRQLSSNEISAVSGGTFNLTNPCAPIPLVLGFFGGLFKLVLTGKKSTSTCTTCGGGTTPPPNYN